MTRLDGYVGRIVAGAFGAALLFFLFLTILLDLLSNLPKYVDRAARQGVGGVELAVLLLGYYAKLLPVLFVTITPFATVIAGMFTVARLQGANEVVPMLFVGRSVQRVLLPVLACGAVAALGMGACWQWVVPHVGASIAADESFLREGSEIQKGLIDERHGEVAQRLYVHEYLPRAARMQDVRLLVVEAAAGDAWLLTADVATWDPAIGDWRLQNGWIDPRSGNKRRVELLERPDLTPAALLQRSRETVDPDSLSYSDLRAMVELRPNRPDFRLALHRHVTYPLANLILLLLALPLAVFFERGSRIERILGAIALCGGYLLLDLTCQSLGQRGHLHPIVAAWSPTIVFGALGITLFGSSKT